jgi:hypothetical protein
MRADEHEGVLNDTENKREHDRMEKRSREILSHVFMHLTDNKEFLLWIGTYVHPMMTQNFPVNNGSLLAHFMGKREMILKIIDEMDSASPGFLRRVLDVRTEYENDLRHAAQKE